MKIVFFGTPYFVIPILESLLVNFQVVCVVTTPDTIKGRKKLLTPSPVKKFLSEKKSDIPVLTPDNLNNDLLEQLKNLSPDLFVVAAYGKIIPQSLLDIPKFGSLNIHPSLLPKYRGPSPIQTAIIKGDDQTGVSIIKMDAELDHGPVVTQWSVPIDSSDTFENLHEKLFNETAKRLPDIITEYTNGTLQPVSQDESQVTFCQKISRENGYFEIDSPPSAEKLDRIIRAYYPWPTAWTKMKMDNGEEKIIKFLPEGKVQLEGGKAMEIKDFLNGYPKLRPQIQKLFPIEK